MAVFEAGKIYEAYDAGIDPITVERRTQKTIWVSNGFASWRMKIDHDSKGNEVAVDRSVPRKWHYAFTFSSAFERKEV